jgi:predicted ATP-grasp superfamily ATP-dependent carboligase
MKLQPPRENMDARLSNGMRAIVLDGHLKSALAIVRSLGKRGVNLVAGAERSTAIALHSRYTNGRFTYPSPYSDRDAFVRAVKAESIRLGGKPVVYTCSDATHLALYERREELRECVVLVYPDQKSVEIAFDKAATNSLARVSGVPTITTYTPATKDELERVAAKLAYPAVVKPRRTLTMKNGIGIMGTAQFVLDKDGLLRTYAQLSETLGEPPLIQERVIGEEYGVEMIAHEGTPLALVAHHRIRSLSPMGGASVLKEILQKGALRDMLITYAEALAHALKWEGPLMVEFKVDGDSRTPKLMELNGRFWGSLPLAVAAGVDMPSIYYDLATGRDLPTESIQETSIVTTRYFMGDLLHLFRVFFARDPMRRFAYPRRMDVLRDFFRTPRGSKSDVWSWRDPKPALMEFVDALTRM